MKLKIINFLLLTLFANPLMAGAQFGTNGRICNPTTGVCRTVITPEPQPNPQPQPQPAPVPQPAPQPHPDPNLPPNVPPQFPPGPFPRLPAPCSPPIENQAQFNLRDFLLNRFNQQRPRLLGATLLNFFR